MKAKSTDRTERRGVAIVADAFESLKFAFREQHESDYGIDAHVELIRDGKPTGRLMALQIKSGPSYLSEETNGAFVFREDPEHIEYWLNHSLPVLVCLVDVAGRVIYWQLVSQTTVEQTKKNCKVLVPAHQRVDSESRKALCAHLAPVVSRDRFTIFETCDVSHAGAKRYSVDVVLNGTLTQSETMNVVRTVTGTCARSRYYRSNLVKAHWGDSDAHVVRTNVYPSAEDRLRKNFVCRSQWISPELQPEFRPGVLDGEHIGDNILLGWNTKYSEISDLHAKATLSKQAYLEVCLSAIEELRTLLGKLAGPLRSLANGGVSEGAFLARCEADLERIHGLYGALTNIGHEPYECGEMDGVLQSVIASMDNLHLYFTERGRERWEPRNRYWLAIQQLDSAETDFRHLDYEMSKVLR